MDIDFDPDWTYLFEIIYPSNRIVLNYGDREELVWLVARHNETGLVRQSPGLNEWQGARTATFPYKTLREAIEAPPRVNAEGYVIYFPDLDYRVKLKQDDYVALHRIVTGLTPRRIWENMKEGKTLRDLCEIVPDEWHEWLKDTYATLMQERQYASLKIWNDYEVIIDELVKEIGTEWPRREFAMKAVKYPNSGLIFALYDNKDINSKLWDLIRPSGE
jgi:RNA ligase